MRVQLVGFDQVLQAVRNLPDKMKVKAMKGIMGKNMKPVAQGIKTAAPTRENGGVYSKTGQKVYQGKANPRNTKSKREGNASAYNTLPGNAKKSIGTKAFSKGTQVSVYAGINKNKRYDGWYAFFVARGTKHISKDDFISRGANPKIATAANNLSSDITDYIVKNARQLGLNAQ